MRAGSSSGASGMWRSLVARLLWEQEAPGSNPGIPTTATTLIRPIEHKTACS